MKRKKEHAEPKIIKNLAEMSQVIPADMLQLAKQKKELNALIMDPGIQKFEGVPDAARKILAAYMMNDWEEYRTVYKFSKEIEGDLLETDLPGISFNKIIMPFPCFAINTEDLKINYNGHGVIGILVCYKKGDEVAAEDLKAKTDKLFKKYKEHAPMLGKEAPAAIDALNQKIKAQMTADILHIALLYEDQQDPLDFDVFFFGGDQLARPIKEIKDFSESEKHKKFTRSDIFRFVVNSLLYVNAKEPDIQESEVTRSHYKKAEKIKATSVLQYDVGFRYAKENATGKRPAASLTGTGHGSPKRPHIRKGHFHTYRTGSGRRNVIVKWLSPIHVNATFGETDVVQRNV